MLRATATLLQFPRTIFFIDGGSTRDSKVNDFLNKINKLISNKCPAGVLEW
jgi:hypothetical protein